MLAYWRVVRKRLFTILTISFVLFIVTLLGTLRQTPIYQSTVLLEIENENPGIVSITEIFDLENVTDKYLQTQFRILESESIARRVIDDLRLHTYREFNPPPMLSWLRPGPARRPENDEDDMLLRFDALEESEVDPDVYARVLERFNERRLIYPIRNSRLTEVSFESESAKLAAEVVNAITATYVESTLEARWNATQRASEWLSQQLLEMKIRLEKSEEALHQYARDRGLLFLDKEGGGGESIVNDRLRRLQEELTRAEADRFIKQALYRLTESDDVLAIPGVGDTQVMQDLFATLARLKSERAELLAIYRPEYPKVQQVQEQINEVENIIGVETERGVARIRKEYEAAMDRERSLNLAFAQHRDVANMMSERSVQYNILKREVETNQQLYEGLLQRLREAGISSGLTASNIRVVDPGLPPKDPVRPDLPLNLAIGLALGLSIGVATAFLQEYLDNTLKHSEDVGRFLQLASLGSIPAVQSLNGHRKQAGMLARYTQALVDPEKASPVEEPEDEDDGRNEDEVDESESGAGSTAGKSPAEWYRIDQLEGRYGGLGEAFRGLRTSVLLSTAEHPPRSVLITSADPGEGKSTICGNLGISLAQMGKRILIIDFDMRRPALHRMFKLSNEEGLVNYLTGQSNWKDQIQSAEGYEQLDILVCGPVPPNPAELVASDRATTLLRECEELYDFVLLDSPPLGSVAEARMLAHLAEGVILAIKGGVTPREVVRRAKIALQNAGANILGVVLNELDLRAADYPYYYQYYYQGYGYYSRYGQYPPVDEES